VALPSAPVATEAELWFVPAKLKRTTPPPDVGVNVTVIPPTGMPFSVAIAAIGCGSG